MKAPFTLLWARLTAQLLLGSLFVYIGKLDPVAFVCYTSGSQSPGCVKHPPNIFTFLKEPVYLFIFSIANVSSRNIAGMQLVCWVWNRLLTNFLPWINPTWKTLQYIGWYLNCVWFLAFPLLTLQKEQVSSLPKLIYRMEVYNTYSKVIMYLQWNLVYWLQNDNQCVAFSAPPPPHFYFQRYVPTLDIVVNDQLHFDCSWGVQKGPLLFRLTLS